MADIGRETNIETIYANFIVMNMLLNLGMHFIASLK